MKRRRCGPATRGSTPPYEWDVPEPKADGQGDEQGRARHGDQAPIGENQTPPTSAIGPADDGDAQPPALEGVDVDVGKRLATA